MSKIWVLTDDRTGHNNQSIAVAENLGLPYEIKKIHYNIFARLPNFLKSSGLTGVDRHVHEIFPPWPDLVIASGRRLAPIARYIKKKSGGKTFLCQMMWPDCPVEDFDILAVPEHDKHVGDNVITTIGAPNNITKEKLAEAEARWLKDRALPTPPVITLLVGGDSSKSRFTHPMAMELIQSVKNKVQEECATLFVTVSRRTSAQRIEDIRQELPSGAHFYNPAEESEDNPYLSYLAMADVIVVTGDSVSMCTEACATGKLVYIFDPTEFIPAKHRKLHSSLYYTKHALSFDDWGGWYAGHTQPNTAPLNEAIKIANTIKTKMGLN